MSGTRAKRYATEFRIAGGKSTGNVIPRGPASNSSAGFSSHQDPLSIKDYGRHGGYNGRCHAGRYMVSAPPRIMGVSVCSSSSSSKIGASQSRSIFGGGQR